MLAMVALTAIVVTAIILIGIVVSMMMMSQKRAQGEVESLAMDFATSINKDDWVGEMNNMTGFSRELVYTSRQAVDEVMKNKPFLRPLAIQMMDEARQSAQLVDSEKQVLTELLLKKLQTASNIAADSQAKTPSSLSLPGVDTKSPKVANVDAGYIEGVLSNVSGPQAIPELKDYDLQQKNISEKGGVYLGNKNALLPSPDDDLNFRFSSLPAPVKGTVSPTRLTSNSVFRKLMTAGPEAGNDFSKCKFLPSAVQIRSNSEMSSGPGDKQKLQGQLGVTISAAASGATLKLP